MDPERKLELAALLRSQAEERATLVVTHDLVFAAEVADRIVTTALARGPSMPLSALLACAAVAFAAAVWTALSPQDAALSLLLVAGHSCSPGSYGWRPERALGEGGRARRCPRWCRRGRASAASPPSPACSR